MKVEEEKVLWNEGARHERAKLHDPETETQTDNLLLFAYPWTST